MHNIAKNLGEWIHHPSVSNGIYIHRSGSLLKKGPWQARKSLQQIWACWFFNSLGLAMCCVLWWPNNFGLCCAYGWFLGWGAFGGDLLHALEKHATLIMNWARLWQVHSTSEQTQWELPVLASMFSFEKMCTQKSDCQVRRRCQQHRKIHRSRGHEHGHSPSTSKHMRAQKHVIGALQKWVCRCLGQHRKLASNYLHVITAMNLTYLFAGWECHCYSFEMFHFCTFGRLVCCKQAEVACANNC